MARKSYQAIVQALLRELGTGPKSINELAVAIETNWTSAERYLGFLKELGFAEEYGEGNSRMFKITTDKLVHEDNLFGLPTRKEQDEELETIYALINQHWKGPRLKTYVEKMAVDIIKSLNLKIPHCWYLYGDKPIHSYKPTREYEIVVDSGKYLQIVKEKVIEYEQYPNTLELKSRKYEEANNGLYKSKLKLESFGHPDFIPSSESKLQLREAAQDFVALAPADWEDLTGEFAEQFISLIRYKPDEELNELRTEIMQTFYVVWQLIATDACKESLKEFYPADLLNSYFKQILENLGERAGMAIDHLEQFRNPTQEVEDMESFEKFRVSLGIKPQNIPRLTKDDRRELLDDFLSK